MKKIWRLGKPGRLDEEFGLIKRKHFVMPGSPFYNIEWTIVWLDTGEPVPGTGNFYDFGDAEAYLFAMRDDLILEKIEDTLLG